MNTLHLHEQHEALGATFQSAGDWEIPISYGKPDQEYEALKTHAGLADLSDRGRVIVTGEDRITWLQSIISQDILPLQPGQGRHSAFMDHKGKFLSYFRVLVQPDSVVLEDVGHVGDQTFLALKKFLLFGTKAKISKGRETQGLLLISGPQSPTILQKVLGVEIEALASLQSLPFSFEGQRGFFAKTDETGGHDLEIFVPKEILLPLWIRLLQEGKPLGLQPIGNTALETARIEAGLPRLGPDLNDRIVPPEANLEGIAFSLSKGCYPGQEVVARMDTYGSVKRRLVGLVIQGGNEELPAGDAKLFSGTREVGWVSSSAFSPQLQKPIALGFPLRDFTEPGTRLEIEVEGHRFSASVSALPFHPQL